MKKRKPFEFRPGQYVHYTGSYSASGVGIVRDRGPRRRGMVTVIFPDGSEFGCFLSTLKVATAEEYAVECGRIALGIRR